MLRWERVEAERPRPTRHEHPGRRGERDGDDMAAEHRATKSKRGHLVVRGL